MADVQIKVNEELLRKLMSHRAVCLFDSWHVVDQASGVIAEARSFGDSKRSRSIARKQSDVP